MELAPLTTKQSNSHGLPDHCCRLKPAYRRLLCELGCDEIINIAKRDLSAAILRRHPGGVDVLLDHVGGRLLSDALGCLREGGRAVLVGYIRWQPKLPRTRLSISP